MLRKVVSYFTLRSYAENQHSLSHSDKNFVTCYGGVFFRSIAKCLYTVVPEP